jgi:arylsulfatase A-like enzyme
VTGGALLLALSLALPAPPAAAGGGPAPAKKSTVADKPNFVVILIDDLGYGDIGPFGATTQKTPHLDRLAREGMRLTCFYAAPVCSPSRASLMTGCYPIRVGVPPGVFFPADPNGLNPDEVTVAELLKEQGYAPACIGKWHLGDAPEFLPTRQGFDYYYGLPYSNDMSPEKDGGQGYLAELRDPRAHRAFPPLPLPS